MAPCRRMTHWEATLRTGKVGYRGASGRIVLGVSSSHLTHCGPPTSDCRDHNAYPVEVGLRDGAR